MGSHPVKVLPAEPSKPETKEVKKEAGKEEAAPVEKKVEKEVRETQGGEACCGTEGLCRRKKCLSRLRIIPLSFTSDGAKLKHLKLKKYFDRVEESAISIALINFVHGILGKEEIRPGVPGPVDLVNTDEG